MTWDCIALLPLTNLLDGSRQNPPFQNAHEHAVKKQKKLTDYIMFLRTKTNPNPIDYSVIKSSLSSFKNSGEYQDLFA